MRNGILKQMIREILKEKRRMTIQEITPLLNERYNTNYSKKAIQNVVPTLVNDGVTRRKIKDEEYYKKWKISVYIWEYELL